MKNKVHKGDKVFVNYVGTLDSGDIFDSTEGREPLSFVVGQGVVLKKFEDCVAGMQLNEKKKVSLEANEAYGEKRDELIVEIPKENFPTDLKLEVGIKLQIRQKRSMALTQAEIIRIAQNTVTLDANHPLAGERLHFEIELVGIE
ncbi:FKBP-type peptidyl-prolyl cis-trans isomerase [Estrella lausannensis]|uniref:Peptidyl-prolyl cis-trans isomerase n=1 Tax=Estrella lausannensis TaxID=483423 RepID=A0A0H5DMM8_9BACT|nr:FKBP-type peptidyl-prolyl cis-trans isomerase [Estrella lausannensis]CRX37376.1 Peptidyl-prolyl cis-trans isomerase [Estrella lausannensis]